MSNTMTLDPPGSITVVGAGPLGVEAALYGRYLGYDVTLIEAESVGYSLSASADDPLPMLPDRCLSPLAISAINAQSPDTPPLVLPTTVGQWIEQALIPLTETDLLRGRLRCPAKVTKITKVPVERDETDDEHEVVPPDFRLTLANDKTVDTEAVVLAVGSGQIDIEFDLPADYFFRIADQPSGDSEMDFLVGLKQIVQIFSQLAGRESLDLYQPQLG